ncbi:hypothetical protein [Cloacibacillus evryensis]|uniref:hypothetical protein n=1 Tax=Cloacibacillus evryensis TaxID=508460 RepID=UPI00370D8990
MTENKSRWHWWALLAGAVLLLSVGCCLWQWLEARIYGAEDIRQPEQEMAAVDNVTDTAKARIDAMARESKKIKESIKSAQIDAASDINDLDAAGVADKWNYQLGRYREGRSFQEREE